MMAWVLWTDIQAFDHQGELLPTAMLFGFSLWFFFYNPSEINASL